MMKIAIGLIAAVIIAASGYFGFTLYTQHQAAAEVDAAFERIRNAGNKASHGPVSYDPWKRTLTVADITSETTAEPSIRLKIANITASGVSQTEPGRFLADLIEATDSEASVSLTLGGSQLQYTYKLSKLTLTGLSGPLQAPPGPPEGSGANLYRFGLEQFARLTASSVAIPTLSTAIKSNAAAFLDGNLTYSGITIEGIKGGKIASTKVDKGTITYSTQVAGKTQAVNGTFANITARDFDTTTLATILDPQKAGDNNSYPVYGHVSIDGYDVTSKPDVTPKLDLHMHFDRIAVDDIAVRPSRLQLPALLAAIPPAGTTPAPAQAREMLEKVAGIYEGLQIGNFEVDGISIDTPQGPAKLSKVHLNLDNGNSDFDIEGLDLRTPQGPFKAGRFALKSIDFPRLMRLSASMSPPGQKPPLEQALALFQVVQGVELKDFFGRDKDNKPVNIDSLAINWSQFVGSIPTQVHLNGRMVAPVSTSDPAQKPLIAAGIQSIKIDADFGLAWTEASGNIVLEPAKLEIAGLAKAEARVVLTNVPRTLFAEPQKAVETSAQVDTGALELTLHDLGVVDLLVDQYAKGQNVSHDAARSAILDAIKSSGEKVTGANPDGAIAVEAIGRFAETPQQTLVIKLTPIGKLPALLLLQLVKGNPLDALAQFKIEASTGL